MTHNAAAAAATGLGLMMFMFAVGITLFVLWIISLIDVVKNDFQGENTRIVWLILLICIAPLATILYQAIGRKQRIQK